MARRICYLCGKLGADTRDHVPPKCLLPKGVPGTTQRLTLWAHRTCNEGFAKDEEYVRDLLGPPAALYADGQKVYQNTNRAWETPQGKRRLKRILSNAVNRELRSPAGLILGQGLVITPEVDRVARVGRKIAQGVIFLDTNNPANAEQVSVVPIATQYIWEERENELKQGNLFWSTLVSEDCRHDNFSHSVAVRRAYVIEETNPQVRCSVVMVVMLYSQSYAVVGAVELKNEPPKEFTMLALNEGSQLRPGVESEVIV